MIQTHLGKLSYFCSPNILRFGLLGRWAFSFFFPLNYSNFLWLVWGQNTSPNPKHIPESKHFLEFKNTCQNPKHVPESAWRNIPESKTLPRIQKHFLESKTRPRIQKQFQESKIFPRIQNTSQNPKTVPRIQNTSQNPKHFWILGRVFRFWEVFLDCDCDQKMSTIFLDTL